MFICFFDIEGIVHKEFGPPGQTMNEKFYCNVLTRLRENIWRKLPDKWHNNSWTMHHENVLADTSLIVQQFLASTNKTVIPHPPYSLDLAPCDFCLFLKMKLKLQWQCFDSIEEIQTESQDVMKTLT
jgi:histone-lysine N-methyltransferase SETMAR